MVKKKVEMWHHDWHAQRIKSQQLDSCKIKIGQKLEAHN
jgi:hypothetical protein